MAASGESILQRVAAGDQSAVAEVMDRFGGLVWSLARRWSNSTADAEDATQEIFLDIWKSAARYDPSSGSETVFVATIARRRMIDKLRAEERRPKAQEISEAMSLEIADREQEDQGMVAAEAAIAARAVSKLDPGQQQILLMGVVQGMTHSEIATATDKPLGTVKTQMRRGLIRVRELIEQGGGAPA